MGRRDPFGILLVFILYLVKTAKVAPTAAPSPEAQRSAIPVGRNLLKAAIGLGVLIVGGHLLVHGAKQIAEAAGITQLTVGATLVAFMTTMPELTTSIVAARQGEGDIAVGNAVGSIFFNTACVLGLSAIIRPFAMTPDTLFIKIPAMIGLLLVLVPFMRSHFRISRTEGAVLLAGYVGFLALMILTGVRP